MNKFLVGLLVVVGGHPQHLRQHLGGGAEDRGAGKRHGVGSKGGCVARQMQDGLSV